MTIKEYLRQYRRALREANDILEEIEAERQKMAGVRAIIYSDMPKSHDTERDLSDAYAKYEHFAAERLRAYNRCQAVMLAVRKTISEAPTELQYRVLYLRYIDGLKWDDVAERIGKTRQWVNTVHGQALQQIRFIYEPEDVGEATETR